MARFRRSFRRSSGSRKRRLTWLPTIETDDNGIFLGQPINQTTTSPTGLAIELIGPSTFARYTAPTITRIVGDLTITTTSDGASNVHIFGLGIIEIEQGGSTAGPITDAYRDWMWTWYGYVATRTQSYPIWNGSASVLVATQNHAGDHFATTHVDVRAQRKMDPGNILLLALELDNVVGTQTIAVRGFLRALLKE